MDLDSAWKQFLKDRNLDNFNNNLDPEAREALKQGVLLAIKHPRQVFRLISYLMNFLGLLFLATLLDTILTKKILLEFDKYLNLGDGKLSLLPNLQ